jgi:hypothetical protein
MPLFSLFRGLFEWRCSESHPSRAGPAKSCAQAHQRWDHSSSARPARGDEARRSRRRASATAASSDCSNRWGSTTSHAARRGASRQHTSPGCYPCPRRCR